jgi:hypothetical protein
MGWGYKMAGFDNVYGNTRWLSEYDKYSKSDFVLTKLDAEDEVKFKDWIKNTKIFNSFKEQVSSENNISLDEIDDDRIAKMMAESKDYDYRGAYKKGVEEEINENDGKPHMSSRAKDGTMLKSPKHQTAWKEFFMQQHKVDPDELGLETIEDAKEWSMNNR